MDRRVISEKTRDALARLRATGRRYTQVLPYGYRLAADGRTLEADPGEQGTLALARRLGARRSRRALPRDLAARGVVNGNGRPFDFQALARMLQRQSIERSVDGATQAKAFR